MKPNGADVRTFVTGSSIDNNPMQPDSSYGFHHLHSNSLHHSQTNNQAHHLSNHHMINNNQADQFANGEPDHQRRLKVNNKRFICLAMIQFIAFVEL